ASMTRTSQPRASSAAATYWKPSSGAPRRSGDGGLMSSTRITSPELYHPAGQLHPNPADDGPDRNIGGSERGNRPLAHDVGDHGRHEPDLHRLFDPHGHGSGDLVGGGRLGMAEFALHRR